MDILFQILFYIVAFGLIISAFGVIFAPRIIYSVSCAFIFFILTGFLFFMLNAPFNAACQIAIYGVAVSIIFVFAVMMTAYNKEKNFYISFSPKVLLAITGIILSFGSVLVFMFEDHKNELSDAFYAKEIASLFDSTFEIAKGIFLNYILAFELLSVFLLIAIVGVGVITIRKSRGDNQ